MNEDTLVVVHAYAGDAAQLDFMLPQYLHHGAPVLILSPEDAPVHIDHPQVTCRSAGKAGWKGAHTIWRQIEHWKIIAEFPQNFLLLNDSDSVCLSKEIPTYLYQDPKTFWSNEIGGPYLNFEPPYFFSREVLLRLIDVTEIPPTDEARERAKGATGGVPFQGGWEGCNAIDGLYVAAVAGIHPTHNIRHKTYPDGVHRGPWYTRESVIDERLPGDTCMIHSVKTKEALDAFVDKSTRNGC